MPACEHTVGLVPVDGLVTAREWNISLAAFIAKVEQSNELGQALSADAVHEFQYCPACGARLDRVALGLMTYDESYTIHLACLDT